MSYDTIVMDADFLFHHKFLQLAFNCKILDSNIEESSSWEQILRGK